MIQTCLQVSSFSYGKSVPNQGIAAWWSILACINYFKDLRESGLYDDSGFMHVEPLKLLFLRFTAGRSRQHDTGFYMRATLALNDLMYSLPEDYGGNKSKVLMNLTGSNRLSSIYSFSGNRNLCCLIEFVELTTAVMSKNNFN